MAPADVVSAVCATESALIGFDWHPFDQITILRFRSRVRGRFTLRLSGVHLFCARQSLLMFGRHGYLPPSEEFAEDWTVLYFDILTGGKFLEHFLAQQLELPSQVVLYSLNGEVLGSDRFARPVHVSLVTGGGHLDVVCELVQLLETHPDGGRVVGVS